MKKILCLIDGLGFGGAQRQIIGLTSLLNKRGYDAWLASYHKKDFYADIIESEGIKNVVLENTGSRWSKFMAVWRLLKKENFDVVITYQDGPNMIGCLLKICDRKFKLFVSDRYTRPKVSRYEKVLYNFYRMADVVIPNAYSQEDYITTNFPFLAKKTTTITNFTDTTYFSPVPISKSVTNIMKILVAGRISESKNANRFLDAISILKKKGVRVHIDWYGNVGYGMESYKGSIIKKCHVLQIDDVISFHPGTNDILSEYRKCDVFCLPSIREGFPNTICEAMSCGRAILCSRICDNPKIVEDGINGMLFNPDSAEDMANVIEKFTLIGNDELLEMGRRNREKAINCFSEETFVEKYINLIER